MKKKQKFLPLAMTLLICLSACTQASAPSASSAPPTSSQAAGSSQSSAPSQTEEQSGGSNFNKEGLPILNEKETFTITVRTNPNSLNTYAEKQGIIDLEEATNVHIEWREIVDSAWADKINLMFTSGDLTDAICGDVSLTNFREFLIPLEGYLDEYAPNITALLDGYDPNSRKALMLAPENYIYGFPSAPPAPWNIIGDLPFINIQWLDKLGLAMPTSTEELYNVLKEFKEKDPNGNGMADEIPLSFQQGWGTYLDSLFCWFGNLQTPTLSSSKQVRFNNGNAEFAGASDELFNALTYFNRLYNDGLLDPEGYSQTLEQYRAKGSGETMVYGVHVSSMPNYIAVGNASAYDVIPPFEGTVWDMQPYASFARPSVVITTECRQPEVLMRMFDYSNSSMELSLDITEGPIGEGYEINESGQWYSIHADKAPDGMNADSYRYLIGTGGRSWAFGNDNSKRYLTETDGAAQRLKAQEPFMNYLPKNPVPVGLSPAENQEIRDTLWVEISTYMTNFKSSAVINGITETQWQEHLGNLQRLKVDEYVAAWQEYYDSKQ